MEIILTINETKGSSIAMDNEIRAGEMTFSIVSKDLIIIDHTDVNPDFKGKGIGKKLLLKIVEMARKQSIKILPLCPFASAVFKKTENIQDVLKQ